MAVFVVVVVLVVFAVAVVAVLVVAVVVVVVGFASVTACCLVHPHRHEYYLLLSARSRPPTAHFNHVRLQRKIMFQHAPRMPLEPWCARGS